MDGDARLAVRDFGVLFGHKGRVEVLGVWEYYCKHCRRSRKMNRTARNR